MDRKEQEKILQDLKANKEVFEMNMSEMDKLLFFRFESLQDAGFSQEEALEIIKARGLLS